MYLWIRNNFNCFNLREVDTVSRDILILYYLLNIGMLFNTKIGH